MRHSLSFRGRVAAAAMITSVAVLLMACALFALEQWGGDRAALMQDQSRLLAVLNAPIAADLARGDEHEAARDLAGLSVSPRVLQASVVAPNGRVIAAYVLPAGQPTWSTPLPASRSAIMDRGRPLGTLTLRLGSEGAISFLPRYLAITGALFFAAVGIALFLGRGLSKRVIEPVDRLSWAMRDVAENQDFVHRVAKVADDEFGRLTDCFNDLLERLQINNGELHAAMLALVDARDAAEAANLMKSQFLANMSHEIRTPLNGVLAMAQIMETGVLDPEQHERLQVIRTSGGLLLSILDDILDVSEIEAGRLTLDETAFDLDQVARAAFERFRLSSDAKGLVVALEVAPDVRGLRFGDAKRVRQIMSNLLSNALKFTPSGEVRMSVAGLGEPGREGVHIRISDTGVGMPADKLPSLFQKFVQLDGSSTRRFGGAGLGLSICHELIGLMNGRIWAESIEGEGSTFHVELPLRHADGEDLETTAPAQTSADSLGLRVLAAEDNPTNQLVLSTILQMFDADTVMVSDGAEAVKAWRAGAFDVILMDIQMPVLDGVAATRAIRAEEAALGRTRTPIYAVTANAMAEQVAQYLAAGMDGHVAKPIELAKLHAALEAALSTGAQSRAA